MNLISLDFSVLSDGIKEIPRKISFLYWKPHYFFLGSSISSILANTISFPFHEHLLLVKSYLSLNWLPFILNYGSLLCNLAGIFFLLVWLWTGLIGITSRFRSNDDDNLILGILGNMIFVNEDNPNYYGFLKSFELYIGLSCFLSNVLIALAPSFNTLSNLMDANKSLIFSVGIGNFVSGAALLITILEGIKSYFEFRD